MPDKKNGALPEQCASTISNTKNTESTSPTQRGDAQPTFERRIFTRRSERVLDVRTHIFRGRAQLVLQLLWIDADGTARPAGSQMWLPMDRVEELISVLREARDQGTAEVNHD
ncbi:hypothetical protein [Burkholderia pseudomallei]|uniref:hypothetical protein n=1 Tax=Burkholderia pseudomallei TaxID=28450 RepID=UPI00052A5926|nr:hypothetical protein [Burkholderia pseudomallei]AIV65332.1 hypothetical protein X993_4154 [Burkholderia pseudomallei K42]